MAWRWIRLSRHLFTGNVSLLVQYSITYASFSSLLSFFIKLKDLIKHYFKYILKYNIISKPSLSAQKKDNILSVDV